MTNQLLQERRVGSREPIELRVGPFSAAKDIASRPVTFYMWSTLQAATRLINGGTATATDISATEGYAAQTLWKLSYTPAAGEDDVPGLHLAEFEVDYGGGQKRQYPGKHRFIEVFILSHRGVVPAP